MAVYLLHFESALHHAQHYTGCASDVEARLKRHRSGNGAKFVKRMSELGISFEVAMIWPDGTPKLEKAIKHRHGSIKDLCPICKAIKLKGE